MGINDKPKIDFYDAETLNFRFSADAKGIDRGDLSSVAWSGDGTHLVAAGQYSAQFQGQWKHPLLTFGRDGRRIGGSLPLGADTVQDLQPCGDGIAVATAQPAFGLVDGHNQIGLWKTSVAPLLNDTVDPGALTIAPDARQVRFGLENGVDEPVSFDVIQGTIASTPSQNIAGAEAEIGRLQLLEDKLKGDDTYWANQVEVQRLAAAGILAHVRGDDKKAVALVRAAADLDATMDKHPATPSSVLPARELLADLLLELNQPAAALVEYRAMLSTDPNRFRSLLGEARAAKQTGDSATAHDAYRKLVALSKPVGPARPELAEATSYLTN